VPSVPICCGSTTVEAWKGRRAATRHRTAEWLPRLGPSWRSQSHVVRDSGGTSCACGPDPCAHGRGDAALIGPCRVTSTVRPSYTLHVTRNVRSGTSMPHGPYVPPRAGRARAERALRWRIRRGGRATASAARWEPGAGCAGNYMRASLGVVAGFVVLTRGIRRAGHTPERLPKTAEGLAATMSVGPAQGWSPGPHPSPTRRENLQVAPSDWAGEPRVSCGGAKP